MISKKTKVIVVLALLIFSSFFTSFSLNHSTASAQTSNSSSVNSSVLNQYEWPQFQGDASATRFSDGPSPSTSAILWKENITGIQSYIAAFDGLIFVCTNTSVVALTQSGSIAWQTPVNMVRNWPIAYEIDSTHMIVESTCLNPTTGAILWTSSQFCADTGIFDANVYSPETQMFYIKVGSDTQAWDFSDPSKPPTLAWDQYVPGGVTTGIGTTYGDSLGICGLQPE